MSGVVRMAARVPDQQRVAGANAVCKQRISQALAMVTLLDAAGTPDDDHQGFEFCDVLVTDAIGGAVALLDAASDRLPDLTAVDPDAASSVEGTLAQVVGVLTMTAASVGSPAVDHASVMAGLWSVRESLDAALSVLDGDGLPVVPRSRGIA